jgi:RNA polymerase sigma factor (sigma-70 family)
MRFPVRNTGTAKQYGYEATGILMTSADERFRRLYASHEREVLAYCLRRVDRDAALDCASETFLVAWRRIDVVPEGSASLAWLYRTAHNVIGNFYRQRDRLRRNTVALETTALTALADTDGPETVIVRRESDDEVIEALGRLRDADRQVLLLSAWEGLPHAEIAEVVGCSTHAVDQRIHRATNRLGKELATHTRPRLGRRLHEPTSEGVIDVEPQ